MACVGGNQKSIRSFLSVGPFEGGLGGHCTKLTRYTNRWYIYGLTTTHKLKHKTRAQYSTRVDSFDAEFTVRGIVCASAYIKANIKLTRAFTLSLARILCSAWHDELMLV